MICPRCQYTNDLSALFCQNCGNHLKIRCLKCETPNEVRARFCMNCGNRLDETLAPNSERKPNPYKQLIPQDSSLKTRSERRVLTVLFADIKGSTALAEKLDPEEWTEIMNVTFDRMTRAVVRYDGTVARLMGDSILAFFGAPYAHEDDPYRAILAGMDMLEALRPYQVEIRHQMELNGHHPGSTDFDVRIGINTGLAVVGEVGTRPYVEYTAMGDSVNLAARLEQTAAPGTIQVSQETYRLVAHFVEAKPLGAIRVKGKSEPVNTYHVISIKNRQGNVLGISTLEAPMIGRTTELSRLQEVIHKLREGYGQIVSLIGDAGLGKSRLIRELRAALDLREVVWIEVASLSFETSQPYGLLKRLLQRVLDLSQEDSTTKIREKIHTAIAQFAKDDREIVGRVLEILFIFDNDENTTSLQGEALQSKLFEGIRIFWKNFLLRPTLLVFDDLHWADLASVDIILHLSDLIEEVAVVFLCVYRPDHDSPAWIVKQNSEQKFPYRYKEIVLNLLNARENGELVSQLLGNNALPEQLLSLILHKTEGNPLFVEEIVKEMIEKGSLVYQKDIQSWKPVETLETIEIPDSLEALLTARLDRLDSNTRRTVQLAAVIGRSFYYRVLRKVAEKLDHLDQDLKILQQNGLILEIARQPEREYMFRHVLTQEAAYNTILLSQRRQFHQQTGEVMEQLFTDQLEEHSPLLAHHFIRSGDKVRAFRYFSMAASRATSLFANLEAILHYKSALDLVTSLDDLAPESHVHLLRGLGLALETQGGFNEAHSNLEQAFNIARETNLLGEEWRCLLALGMLWVSRDYAKAGELFQQTLDIARELGDPVILGTSLNRLGNWHINLDKPKEAIKYHQEALKIFEKQKNESGIAETLDLLGMTALLGADPVSSAGYYRKAINLFRKLDNRPGLVSSMTGMKYCSPNYQSNTVYPADTLPNVIKGGEPEIELARKINSKAGESWAAWSTSLAYGAHGRYGKAFELAERGIQIAIEIQHRQWMAGGKTALGSIYLDILHYDKAIVALEEARQLGVEVDSQNWIKTATGFLAVSYILAGKIDKADEILGSTLSAHLPMETVGQRSCWLGMAELRIAQGDPQAALEIADALVVSAPSRPPDGIITTLWKIQAEALTALGRIEEAERLVKAAIDNGLTQGEYPLIWRLYALQGSIYQKKELISEAIQAFMHAQQVIDQIAVTIPDMEMEKLFRERAHSMISTDI